MKNIVISSLMSVMLVLTLLFARSCETRGSDIVSNSKADILNLESDGGTFIYEAEGLTQPLKVVQSLAVKTGH